MILRQHQIRIPIQTGVNPMDHGASLGAFKGPPPEFMTARERRSCGLDWRPAVRGLGLRRRIGAMDATSAHVHGCAGRGPMQVDGSIRAAGTVVRKVSHWRGRCDRPGHTVQVRGCRWSTCPGKHGYPERYLKYGDCGPPRIDRSQSGEYVPDPPQGWTGTGRHVHLC